MNINEQLSIHAKQNPNHIAYIFHDQATSYSDFEQQVKNVSFGLAKLGYKKGDHLALIAWNSPYFLMTMYGALRLGLVVIPINPMYTVNEMEYILKNGDVKAVIAMDVILDQLNDSMEQRLPNVRHFISCDTGEQVAQTDHSLFPRHLKFTELFEIGKYPFEFLHIHEDDPAVILYTSGTTGHPKGTILSHRSVYYGAKSFAEHFQIKKSDRMITTLPMFHVFSLMVAVNGPLVHGATLLMMQDFSPREVFRLAKKYQATIFAGVPTMFSYLLQNDTDEFKKKESFQSIRLSVSGGSPFPVVMLREFQQLFGVQVIEGYGLTEAAPVTFNPDNGPIKPGSIGVCVPYMEAKVVDVFGEEVVDGIEGELVVKGAAMMKEYYKKPEETANALRENWFYTGDIAYRDCEGYFYIVDRKKDVVIVNGYNVYPREVEEVLYKHPYVVEAAIVGRPHPNSGEEIIGFVVTDNHKVSAKELIQFCKRFLAEYKIPTSIEFMEELPRNTTGKILKTMLKQKAYEIEHK
ncbi:MAG TPA: AMP-binding protein [Bacillota bacterium]